MCVCVAFNVRMGKGYNTYILDPTDECNRSPKRTCDIIAHKQQARAACARVCNTYVRPLFILIKKSNKSSDLATSTVVVVVDLFVVVVLCNFVFLWVLRS
jgi:hypothetical protein